MFTITINKIKAFWKKLFTKKDLKKTTFVGSRVIQPGHKVFEYNFVEDKLLEATFVKSRLGTRKAIKMNERCIYVSALNRKNAVKKLNQKNYPIKF